MTATRDHTTAGPDSLAAIAHLVTQARPAWPEPLTRVVLHNLATRCDVTDLAIAALRAALDDRLPTPKAIGWRGEHWRGLDTTPPEIAAPERCGVCGKPEPRCYSERVGVDDDHVFEPRRRAS